MADGQLDKAFAVWVAARRFDRALEPIKNDESALVSLEKRLVGPGNFNYLARAEVRLALAECASGAKETLRWRGLAARSLELAKEWRRAGKVRRSLGDMRRAARDFEQAEDWAEAGPCWLDLGSGRREQLAAANCFHRSKQCVTAGQLFAKHQAYGEAARCFGEVGDRVRQARCHQHGKQFSEAHSAWEEAALEAWTQRSEGWEDSVCEQLRLSAMCLSLHERDRTVVEAFDQLAGGATGSAEEVWAQWFDFLAVRAHDRDRSERAAHWWERQEPGSLLGALAYRELGLHEQWDYEEFWTLVDLWKAYDRPDRAAALCDRHGYQWRAEELRDGLP